MSTATASPAMVDDKSNNNNNPNTMEESSVVNGEETLEIETTSSSTTTMSNTTNKSKDNNTTNKKKMNINVSIQEDKNQILEIPNRKYLEPSEKELFWWSRQDIARARRESYMMAQIRIHVEEKLNKEEEYEDPDMLQDRIDEISQWEPGDIADFLQRPTPATKRKIPAKNDSNSNKPATSAGTTTTTTTNSTTTTTTKTKKNNKLSEKEAEMMAQIRFHVQQKLLQIEDYGNDPDLLAQRVFEITTMEPKKIAEFLQTPNPPNKRKVFKKKDSLDTLLDDHDNENDNDNNNNNKEKVEEDKINSKTDSVINIDNNNNINSKQIQDDSATNNHNNNDQVIKEKEAKRPKLELSTTTTTTTTPNDDHDGNSITSNSSSSSSSNSSTTSSNSSDGDSTEASSSNNSGGKETTMKNKRKEKVYESDEPSNSSSNGSTSADMEDDDDDVEVDVKNVYVWDSQDPSEGPDDEIMQDVEPSVTDNNFNENRTKDKTFADDDDDEEEDDVYIWGSSQEDQVDTSNSSSVVAVAAESKNKNPFSSPAPVRAPTVVVEDNDILSAFSISDDTTSKETTATKTEAKTTYNTNNKKSIANVTNKQQEKKSIDDDDILSAFSMDSTDATELSSSSTTTSNNTNVAISNGDDNYVSSPIRKIVSTDSRRPTTQKREIKTTTTKTSTKDIDDDDILSAFSLSQDDDDNNNDSKNNGVSGKKYEPSFTAQNHVTMTNDIDLDLYEAPSDEVDEYTSKKLDKNKHENHLNVAVRSIDDSTTYDSNNNKNDDVSSTDGTALITLDPNPATVTVSMDTIMESNNTTDTTAVTTIATTNNSVDNNNDQSDIDIQKISNYDNDDDMAKMDADELPKLLSLYKNDNMNESKDVQVTTTREEEEEEDKRSREIPGWDVVSTDTSISEEKEMLDHNDANEKQRDIASTEDIKVSPAIDESLTTNKNLLRNRKKVSEGDRAIPAGDIPDTTSQPDESSLNKNPKSTHSKKRNSNKESNKGRSIGAAPAAPVPSSSSNHPSKLRPWVIALVGVSLGVLVAMYVRQSSTTAAATTTTIAEGIVEFVEISSHESSSMTGGEL